MVATDKTQGLRTSQGSENLLSKTAYGRHANISIARVHALVRDGLPLDGNKVPVAAADAWMAENVEAPRRNAWKGAGLNELRRERERIKVESGKLALAKAKGELVEAATVTKFLSRRARQERDSWLAWASAAAGRMATALQVEHGALFAALEAEVRAQLQHLADAPLIEDEGHDESADAA